MAPHCELYPYTPSPPLAVTAVILFSALTSVHSLRMIQTRTWDSLFFVLGGIAQMSGYTARLDSTQYACNRAAYGVQSVLLLLGPTLLMFSVNLTQSAFAKALDAGQFCWTPVSWQRTIYLNINTVLLILQAVGGIMTVASTSITFRAIGSKISIAIYGAQTVFWLFTLAENISMGFRLGRHPTEASATRLPDWKRWNQLFGLSVSIIGIGRNIVRLTMNGGIPFLIINEWPSYAFDGFQMVVVLGAWAVWYLPAKCLHVGLKRDYVSLERTRRNEEEEV